MTDTLELIQALSQEQREYIKMKLIQSLRENLDEAIKKEAASPKKLVIKNLRQFIPLSSSGRKEELTSFIDKNFFEYERAAAQLEKHTNSV